MAQLQGVLWDAGMEQNWKGAVSYVSDRCPALSFGDRSKIASELWELQKTERDTLRAQRDCELEELRAMRLVEQQKLKELQDAERQYARIERAVLWVIFLLATIMALASFIALSYQATYGQKECHEQLEDVRAGAQQQSRGFADGQAEIQRLAQRLTP